VNPHALHHVFASALSVDFDLTFLAQFVLFTTFILVLQPLLFEPLMRVFEERERRTDGMRQRARELDAEAGELRTHYDAELDKVRREAGVERERMRAETARLEAQIMAEAREETARIIEAGKARVAAEVASLRKELASGRPELTAQIASRILGREVSR
jgi:F-type H+-transporting ATPase subunit b